jgi:AcrR family transcriptional regulator
VVLAQRARSSEQKSERRREILQAARALFQAKPFQAISMADVAGKAGMAKGTVFLYFKTKEQLFLELTALEFEALFDALDASLEGHVRRGLTLGKARFMRVLQEVLGARLMLVRLIAIQHVILERNIGYAEARAFKLALARRVESTGALLERAVPLLKAGWGARWVLWMYAFVIGFAHVAEPAPVMRKVYEKEPEAQRLRIRFGDEYFAALSTVWDGWKLDAGRGRATGK